MKKPDDYFLTIVSHQEQ